MFVSFFVIYGVCLFQNRTDEIKKYSITLLHIVPLYLFTFFATLVPPPLGGGKRFFGDGGGDPRGGIDAVGVSRVPIKGLLHMRKQEEVRRPQFRHLGQVGQALIGGGEPYSNKYSSSSVNKRIIPVENWHPFTASPWAFSA